jgi:hypothetical protein
VLADATVNVILIAKVTVTKARSALLMIQQRDRTDQ